MAAFISSLDIQNLKLHQNLSLTTYTLINAEFVTNKEKLWELTKILN